MAATIKRTTTYFVRRPRTIHDRYQLHGVDWERPYQIVTESMLVDMGYENFRFSGLRAVTSG